MAVIQGSPAPTYSPAITPSESSTIDVEVPGLVMVDSPERTHRTRSDKLRMNLRRKR